MTNKASGKKAVITTVIFCIIIVLGIVLSFVMGVNTNSTKVRNVTVTFEGSLTSKTIRSEFAEHLDANVVLKEVTVAADAEEAEEADEGETETTTTTTAAGTFNSGKFIATVTDCDNLSDEEIKSTLSEIFAEEAFADSNMAVESITTADSIAGFNVIQIYLCVIVLVVAFVYALIRFHATGALASGLAVVISSVLASAVAVCASLICGVFVGSNISIVAGIALIMAIIFANVILENIVSGNPGKSGAFVLGMGAILILADVLIAVVGIIGGNMAILGYCVPGLFAILASVISALAYVDVIWSRIVPQNKAEIKKASKKVVIK